MDSLPGQNQIHAKLRRIRLKKLKEFIRVVCLCKMVFRNYVTKLRLPKAQFEVKGMA